MVISYRFIGLLILSIGTCFIFFNPLNLTNEIFPYYLLSIFFVPLKIKDYLLSILLTIAAILWFVNFPSFRIFIDPVMILSTIFAFRFFCELDGEEKKFFFNFIKYFIFLIPLFALFKIILITFKQLHILSLAEEKVKWTLPCLIEVLLD